jgi:hypothetical protein
LDRNDLQGARPPRDEFIDIGFVLRGMTCRNI